MHINIIEVFLIIILNQKYYKMGNNSAKALQKDKDDGIFSEEPKSFDALLNLLYTNIGFNTYLDPWNKIMIQIDP